MTLVNLVVLVILQFVFVVFMPKLKKIDERLSNIIRFIIIPINGLAVCIITYKLLSFNQILAWLAVAFAVMVLSLLNWFVNEII